MRTGNLLFSAVQFLFVVALVAIGGFLYALPLAPSVRFKLAAFLTDRPDLLRPFGVMVFIVGIILGIGFYAMYKRRFYRVRLYSHQPETLNLDRAKTTGIDDRKEVNISNINLFTIVNSREFSRRSKSTFQADGSIAPHPDVEVPLIRSLVERYWKEAFPDHSLGADVFLHKDQKIEIFLEMPLLDEKQSQIVLKRVETQLGALLKKQIEYDREFFVTVILKN